MSTVDRHSSNPCTNQTAFMDSGLLNGFVLVFHYLSFSSVRV